jgi:HD-GYP domain-containing protein (c-di-GMP phosphodiesterase class II)
MRLAMPVTHPDNPAQELLRKGFALDAAVLERLRDLAVRWVYVDYPGLEDLDRHLAATLSPERRTLYGQVKASLNHFQRAADPQVDYWDYYSTTRDFIATLVANGPNPIYVDELSKTLGGDAVEHGLAVAHLALVMGLKLQPYLVRQRRHLRSAHAKDIVNLGIAGMLHDLGKTRIPVKLRAAHALRLPENDADRADWRAHAVHGYELLRDTIKPTAAAAVLHHHQHFDGSGFPSEEPQEGDEIHVYARILMAADLYERLALGDDGKTRRSNLEILHLMRQRYAEWLDPEILVAMPKVVPPFPPGSKVTLCDGRRAVVTEVEPEHPYRPVVRPLMSDGRSLEPESIRLRKCPELSIQEAGGIAVGDMIHDVATVTAA